MKFVNLTKKVINLTDADGNTVHIAPSGNVAIAHVDTVTTLYETIDGHDYILDLVRTSKQFDSRFPPREGVLYLVPRIVAQAFQHRSDLRFPYRILWGAEFGEVDHAEALGTFNDGTS